MVTISVMLSLGGPADPLQSANARNADPLSPNSSSIKETHIEKLRTVWQLLALPDSELEKVDVIELNLAVARGIPGLENLDIAKYQRIVDGWANDIRPRLPAAEQAFARTPEKWQNDVRFFRLGVVAS